MCIVIRNLVKAISRNWDAVQVSRGILPLPICTEIVYFQWFTAEILYGDRLESAAWLKPVFAVGLFLLPISILAKKVVILCPLAALARHFESISSSPIETGGGLTRNFLMAGGWG